MAEQAKKSTLDKEETAEAMSLHTLKPAPGSRRSRKRIGRGHGSGHGKTSGRGHKGYGSRSGAKKRARFEGGQNPIHMRMRKLRGPNKRMSMPFEPFRTFTQAVNLSDLEKRFDAQATIDAEALAKSGLAKKRDIPIKILARGELTKPLTVHAHRFSKTAREKIEAAGGSCVVLES
jgi:large subunit ribosomal protein L15